MRFSRVLGVLAAVALAATACADQTDTADDLDIPPATETTPPAVTPAPAEGASQTLTLSPIGDATVAGEVEIAQENGALAVDVQLRNATPGAVHKGHIHSGTCDALGSVVAPLEDITIDDNGEGTSENTVSDVPVETVTDGQHIVAFHEAGGSPGAPIVCTPIPAS